MGIDVNERGYGTGAATGGVVRSRARTSRGGGGGGVSFAIEASGFEELHQAIEDIVKDADDPNDRKAMNAALRKAIKWAVTNIIKPAVMERMPYDDSKYKDEGQHLEDQVVVKAVKRSKNRVGYAVGFPWPLREGPTFYAFYIEFGWDHVGGMHIEADSFLREALYANEGAVLESVRGYLLEYVGELNQIGGA